MILDGWGNGRPYEGNAIHLAHKPNMDALSAGNPVTELKTSGEDVGLPEGQMGNSEVGHMNIGAGRVVFQQLVLINKAFREKSVEKNPVLKNAIQYAQENNKKLHLIGLVSDGGVHASMDHLMGLCTLLNDSGLSGYCVHAFTDGRDTDPKSGFGYIQTLQQHLYQNGGRLASVTGRYYSMDRDKRWERVSMAYQALVHGKGEYTEDILSTIQNRYQQGETDEFLKPIIQTENGKPIAVIESGDVVICFNFRTDRGREITMALTQQDFPEHDMKHLDLHYITLTEYDKTFKNIGVVFPDIELNNTLGEVLEQHHKKQIRIAETEKYPHVTFFFSGGREEPFAGESRRLCPSPKVATYDLQPEMSAEDVCKATIESIESEPDFICVNFANPDMVGHTGVISAEILAVQKVDECVGRIVPKALEHGYSVLITADHGNGEYMINTEDGSPNTAHTTNSVPLLLVDQQNKYSLKPGRLADLAPTVLSILGIPQPPEMTGTSLLQ